MFVPIKNQSWSCDCGDPSPIFDPTVHEEICQNCGVVLERVLYDGRDWSFSEDHDTSRVGMPGAPLGTFIDIPGMSKRIAASVESYADRLYREYDATLDSYCGFLKIEVPSVIRSTARDMFFVHATGKSLGGDVRKGSLAAALYFACRAEKADREIRDISRACSLDIKVLNACVRAVKESLLSSPYAEKVASGTLGPLITRFVNNLNLDAATSKRLWRDCCAMEERIHSSGIMDSGRRPRTIVSGIIGVAAKNAGVNLPRNDVVAATGVCAQTVDLVTRLIEAQLATA